MSVQTEPPGTGLRDQQAGATAFAEVGLLALAMGTAASLNRLFLGWSFLAELALCILCSWGSALLMRRFDWPVRAALPASAGLGAMVLTWLYAPGTGLGGVVPTPPTATAISSAIQESFGDFSRLIAPVPATDGFLVVLAALFWMFGFFADTGCFRYRSPVQAAVPYAATFVAVGVLAREPGRTTAAVAFGAGVALYAVSQRTFDLAGARWVRGEQRRGTSATAGTGALLAATALVAGLILGPLLPGGTEAVVDLRDLGRAGGSRTVVSPFVGVRAMLGERSDAVMFTVESPQGAYWRLTSLEEYDPQRAIWVSRGSYRRVDGVLEGDADTRSSRSGTDLDQEVRIASLGNLWLPAAFEPVQVESEDAVSFDPGSSSVITRSGQLSPGSRYRVLSKVPALDPDAFTATRSGGTASSAELDPVYTQDPGLSSEVESAARRAVQQAGAESPYEQALALQDLFRRPPFTYDEDVDYRDDPDPVAAFLRSGRGFCQQFASTFALMARSLGLPARVAVGFTPGDQVDLNQVAEDAGGTAGSAEAQAGEERPGFVVRGRHAHAWPEVHVDGIGWVAFEPTPGRGNPQAEQYTGVPAAQASPPPPQAVTTTPTTAAPPPGAPTTTPSGSPDVAATAEPDPPPEATDSGRVPWWQAVLLVAVVAVAAVALTVAWRVLRRRHHRHDVLADPHGGRVALAWEDAVDWLGRVGLRPSPAETPVEFMARAHRSVGVAEVADLARIETSRRFGQSLPAETDAEAAEEVAAAVRAAVQDQLTRTDRARHLIRSAPRQPAM